MTDAELDGAFIEATRGAILKEYEDGTLAIRITIEPRLKKTFMELLPDVGLPIFIARRRMDHEKPKADQWTAEQMGALDVAAPPLELPSISPAGSFGQQAKALRLYPDWMCRPEVWKAFGTDEDYMDWCRQQQCASCKWQPHWEMDRHILCEAAHVRRVADGAGTAIKPPYATIPLCHRCHALQHEHGEDRIGGRDWCDRQRMGHVQGWLWEQMKVTFQVDSMRQLAPTMLLEYARSAGVDRFLPQCYRGAT